MGIIGDEDDILSRSAFGSNTYPRKEGVSCIFFRKHGKITLIILIIADISSLALGIKTEGIEEDWYDGGSIAFAIFLVITVTGIGQRAILFFFS
ncbi:hypothetical protein SAY86_000811 [Trapa natans]|uniref:Uncharacterized protein n=1 Tax=Trapa natans TaxID=22666 RepID=A0AAN7RNA3_TRANT|nr:hypothetical protein SAY86_000811 [Trapa natans]